MKRHSVIVNILLGIFWFLLIVVILLAGWIAFSALNKKSSISHLPEDYAVVLHADSLYDGLSPLIDLKAVDALLAEPSLASYRGTYMTARSILSGSSFLWNLVLSRRADVAVYEGTKYVAAVDMGWLSAATRLANPLGNMVAGKVKNLEYRSDTKNFEYKTENSTIYIRFEKNLAVVSSDEMLFLRSKSEFGNEKLIDALGSKKSMELKVVADAKKAASVFLGENKTADKFLPFIQDDSLTLISFSISNENIDLKLNLPLNLENADSKLVSIFQKGSSSPMIFSRLPDGTQYFTLINLCPLEGFIDIADELYPEKKLASLMTKAEAASRSLFGLTLDEMLFSWSGNEIAVLGMEDNSAPVFAFQVTDEKQLRKVIDTLGKSILINNNTSLILGGMRLSCLELPPVFSALVNAFGFNVPRPYYMINNGYIYFSEAPQNLSNIYARSRKNAYFAKNLEWRDISKKMDSNTSFSVYYDLKRSLPFFIDSSEMLSKILRLYNLGRCDLTLSEGTASVHLHAIYSPEASSKLLPSFPLKTGKPAEYALEKCGDTVYRQEDGKIIGVNLHSLEQIEFELPGKSFIAVSGSNEKLWVASESGNVYLLDKKLQPVKGFPIVSGTNFSAKGTVYKDTFYLPTIDGNLAFIKENGEFGEIYISEDANFRSAPAYSGDGMFALYSRGFEGEIYLVKNDTCINSDEPIIVDGVGFGSPSVISTKSQTLISFMTQSGEFYVYDQDGSEVENFPVTIDDVFFTNAVSYENSWYILSESAKLYRISRNGEVLAVQLPDTVSARDGIINVCKEKNREGIYVSGDSNLLFGFTKDLELIDPYPLTGRGKPVFVDVNKDGSLECVVLSSTRELSAWNLD